jgi:hypothetical protein
MSDVTRLSTIANHCFHVTPGGLACEGPSSARDMQATVEKTFDNVLSPGV